MVRTRPWNGLRLHYLDWGNPDAPPLVYLHGVRGTAHNFDGPARRLHDRFHVIAPDVRGRGESDWSPDGAYEHRYYLENLIGLVDALGLEQLNLIGSSMGGVIAMNYAGARGHKLVRLVINDIGPDETPGNERITQGMLARPGSFPSLDEALAYFRRTVARFSERSDEAQHDHAAAMLKQAADGSLVWKVDPTIIRQRAERGGPEPRPPLWPVLARITCPTLVVWGMDSDVLPEQQAKRMVETLPRGELIAVPGVGHAPTLMEPVAWAALERFLTAPE